MKIHLNKIKVPASVGVYPHEKTRKTNLIISITITLQPPKEFKVEDILDYDLPLKIVKETVNLQHFEYIEELAILLKERLYAIDKKVEGVVIKVQKCILGNFLEEIAIELS